jgi:hypothetical protein
MVVATGIFVAYYPPHYIPVSAGGERAEGPVGLVSKERGDREFV